MLMRLLRWCAGLLALGAASVAILAFLGFAVPVLDVLNHLAIFVFLAVTAGVVVAVLLLRPGRWRSFVVAFAATGFVASATTVVPEVVLSFLPRAPVVEGRPVLKLVTHNLYGRNYEMQRVAAFIYGENPDIIALQEYFPEQREELAPLLEPFYPYSAVCSGGRRANVAMFSRLPFEARLDGACREDAPPTQRTSRITGKFTLEDGTTFSVVTTHLDWPYPTERQRAQFAELAEAVDADAGPLLLVGDFNSTPWSYALRGFGLATGLERQTHNLVTYPLTMTFRLLRRTFPFLPLDHVFTRGIDVHELHRGPDTGSDHLPVVVTFSVEPIMECCAVR